MCIVCGFFGAFLLLVVCGLTLIRCQSVCSPSGGALCDLINALERDESALSDKLPVTV